MIAPRTMDQLILAARVRMQLLRPSQRRRLWAELQQLDDEEVARQFIADTAEAMRLVRKEQLKPRSYRRKDLQRLLVSITWGQAEILHLLLRRRGRRAGRTGC